MNRFACVHLYGLICTATFVTTIVHAESDEIVFPNSHPTSSFESPQNFYLELRVGPYMPQIDSEPGLTSRPYDLMYGNAALPTHAGPSILNAISPGARFYGGAEFSWQAARIPHLGTVGPGLGAGFTRMTAPSFQTGPLLNGQYLDSGDKSTLMIIPMYVMAVLRADVLTRDIGIPLVPYVKGGIGGAVWRASNSVGISRSADGKEALGVSFGWHFAAGIAFDVGVLDRSAERDLDIRTGINHMYLFGEYMLSALHGFGGQDTLRVGTSTLVIGLALEF